PVVLHRYFIELAYNGSGFHGWQIQPGVQTVQETLNHALACLTGEQVNVIGCGRTDTGVHASHFVAHFDLAAEWEDPSGLGIKLGRFLRNSIRIDRIAKVQPGTHARFSATSRTYHYLIAKRRHPFLGPYCWEHHPGLNLDPMNRMAGLITGRHDFTSFSKLHTDTRTNLCEVFEAEWRDAGDFLVLRIRADRFLRNMVRALVGTMVEAGKGHLDSLEINRILAAKNRSEAGMSVPAQGLFLTRVDYPEELFAVDPKQPFPALIREP
ncbi:MAG: tRNA pseudouridine(38-40) synthase TruA, partial [Bacteroidales bacterium]